MTTTPALAFALLVLGAVGVQAHRRAALTGAPAHATSIVHVAPPAGDAADRERIVTALEQARPGDTIQFAPGTYLMGELITVSLPRLTWQGHPEGTTLRGCEPAAYEQMQREWEAATGNLAARIAAGSRCGGLLLTGGYGTVRDLTFENMQTNLRLGAEFESRTSPGGYRIEGNTFRSSDNGVRSGFLSSDSTIIRGNTFVAMIHAVVVFGGHVHMLDNDISAPRPERVRSSSGSPGIAIGIRREHNVIMGNRIDGHPDGILLTAGAGMSSRYNVIRDNIIRVLRSSADQSEVFLVPLALENPGGAGILEDNRIEGNRIVGGEGIGIELRHASRNRIANNTITGIAQMRPPPAAVLDRAPGWFQWNGSGIWVSPGSKGNEIVGNTFERIAAHAIVLEGDSNRVELLHARDTVHDQGNGNRVGGRDRPDGLLPRPGDDRVHEPDRRYQSKFVETRGIRLQYMDFGGSGLPVILVQDVHDNFRLEEERDYSAWLARFVDGFRVLAPVRRGYGESDDTGWGYDVATQSEDLLGIMDALGIDRAVLVGRTVATQDMTWLAEHYPERLAGLVYLEAPIVGPDYSHPDVRTFDEMYARGTCDLGDQPAARVARVAPRATWRPHFLDDDAVRIDVPALRFSAPQFENRSLSLRRLDRVERLAASDHCGDEVSRTYFRELATDATRVAALRQALTEGDVSQQLLHAMGRGFGANLRTVREGDLASLEAAMNFWYPHIRRFLEEVARTEAAKKSGRTP